MSSLEGWVFSPEVSFSIYGERGVIDILAFHEPSGSPLVIELKTDIVDVNELIGTMDRKRRLAPEIARARGWEPLSVSSWVIVERVRTNQRRIQAQQGVLRAAFPAGGRSMWSWLRAPSGELAALSTWTDATAGSMGSLSRHRVGAR